MASNFIVRGRGQLSIKSNLDVNWDNMVLTSSFHSPAMEGHTQAIGVLVVKMSWLCNACRLVKYVGSVNEIIV